MPEDDVWLDDSEDVWLDDGEDVWLDDTSVSLVITTRKRTGLLLGVYS
jgi:hypothetical protein